MQAAGSQKVSLASKVLDERFGPSLTPEMDISTQEMSLEPRTLQRLTSESASNLKKYMECTTNGLSIPSIVHQFHTIIWIVDNEGEIWFALEEAVDRRSGVLLYPLPRSKVYRRPKMHVKLGHPALVRDPKKAARIGGEIIFDPPYGGTSGWVINNASGRFGLRSHTRKSHLEEVCNVFSGYGISMDVRFI